MSQDGNRGVTDHGVTNDRAPGDLTPDRVTARLSTRRFGRAYELLATCASTNDLAAMRARANGPEGLLIVADRQTGGRGRLGRSWHSPAGENLYLSLVLRPGTTPAALPPITLLAGAVLAEVLAGAGVEPVLKWPNDVLLPVGGELRKVAGVLTEMASDRDRIRHVVVGIGLNVNALGFPPELEARATSLRLATGRPHDRAELLAALLNVLERAYDRLLSDGPGPCLAAWRSFARLPRACQVDDPSREGRIEGVAIDIDPEGALLIRDALGRVHRVFSGEIVL